VAFDGRVEALEAAALLVADVDVHVPAQPPRLVAQPPAQARVGGGDLVQDVAERRAVGDVDVEVAVAAAFGGERGGQFHVDVHGVSMARTQRTSGRWAATRCHCPVPLEALSSEAHTSPQRVPKYQPGSAA
jgi:hypothetical protein